MDAGGSVTTVSEVAPPPVGKGRKESLEILVQDVKDLLSRATKHGRILVGRDDENGLGDDIFPASTRRYRKKMKWYSRDVITSVRSTYVPDHTLSLEQDDGRETDEESEILDRAPVHVPFRQILEGECKYLLDHRKKVEAAEARVQDVVVEEKALSDVSGVEYNDLEAIVKDVLVTDFLVSSRTITAWYHTQPGNQVKRGGSLSWETEIHISSSVNKPGGDWMKRPDRFSMIDRTESYDYVSLLPVVYRPEGYDPEYEAELLWEQYTQKRRREQLAKESEERERLAEMKEFLRLRQAAKERESRVWERPAWFASVDVFLSNNEGNGYVRQFGVLTKKYHANQYLLTGSPFHALSRTKMHILIKNCKHFQISYPKQWLTRLYRKYCVRPQDEFEKASLGVAREKFTTPGVIDVDYFLTKFSIKTPSLAKAAIGAHIDIRGALMPFDAFVMNIFNFIRFNPVQVATVAMYGIYDLKSQAEGYLMENFLMIINRLHGTEGNPLAEDLSDSDYEEENREELYSRFIERRDKAWVARYILQCVRSDCTSAEFVKRVLEFPILLWPIFDLQQQFRRKLFGEDFWRKYAINHSTEGFPPEIEQLSKYLNTAKHHKMSEKLAWGLTSRSMLVDGARRRHSSALISKSFLQSVFGRSRSRNEKILLIQVWWRLLKEEHKAKSLLSELESTLKQNRQQLQKIESKVEKLSKKERKQKQNLGSAIERLNAQVNYTRDIAFPSVSMRDRIKQREIEYHNNAPSESSPEISGASSLNGGSVLPPIEGASRPETLGIETESIEKGTCIVPHCYATIDWMDEIDCAGLCSACRTYSVNYWAMQAGYKWSYRLVRRAQRCRQTIDPKVLESNTWLMFRDALVRSNFYFNVNTGEPRWQLLQRHYKNRKTLKVVKLKDVLTWEKERAMKRKFAAEVKKAQLAKELAMAKKNRYRKKH